MLAMAGVMHASQMVVVLYTTDRVVVDHMRRVDANTDNRILFRSEVQVEARINWHVVGGKAPYTLVDQHCEGMGIVSVTVMDACGRIASAKRVIREIRHMRLDDTPLINPAAPCMTSVASFSAKEQDAAALKARIELAKRQRMYDQTSKRQRTTGFGGDDMADRKGGERKPSGGSGRRTMLANREMRR
jgi:hypothetical protein